MTTDPENIPSVIFDWLEQQPFSALRETQKKTVLEHFSESEYNELHVAITGIRTTLVKDKNISRSDRKNKVMAQFDAAQDSRNTELVVFKASSLWRAASIFLLLLSAWLGYRLLGNNNTTVTASVSKKDTVFVTKIQETPAAEVFDTIYVVTQPKGSSKMVTGRSTSRKTVQIVMPEANDGLNVLRIGDLKRTANNPRKTSLKDDSVAARYGFVAL
jgi:hypothetical protein